MKVLKTIFLSLIMAVTAAPRMTAQFMPVVYDNTYGKSYQFTSACAGFQNGDIVTAGVEGGSVVISWIDRAGEARFSKRFSAGDLSVVNKIIPVSDENVLLVGKRAAASKDRNPRTGSALLLNVKGVVERAVAVGENGTELTGGRFLPNGNLILSGNTPGVTGQKKGFLCKVSPANRELYTYVPAVGGTCDHFNVLGSNLEIVNASFSSAGSEGSSVVRLDDKGMAHFITQLPDNSFNIEAMASDIDGMIYIAGQGDRAGGAVIKIRPEGDIVFQKQIIPASAATRMDRLILCPTGELMVGGSDMADAYFLLLRPDGTELTAFRDRGSVSVITNNPSNGDCYVSIFNPQAKMGKVAKFTIAGHRLYEKTMQANYTALSINYNGDVLLASPQTGRLSMLSNYGELLFDRFVVENTPQPFADALLPDNGEAFFIGQDNRVAKLAHGLYVSDIAVNEPIEGHATAIFTVTLSGYSYNKEGRPMPVKVDYETSSLSAEVNVNYEAVSGTLSFLPSEGGEQYLNKAVVEVPVLANDLLEGNRVFKLNLSNVKESYVIKGGSTATIKDQPAIVKLIGSTPGIEGERDVVMELGIFKTNGTRLTNRTQSDIVIEGSYGNGTADRLDFDMGIPPRLLIAHGKQTGKFNVATLEDLRYESVKTVVVNFNRVSSMSDTDVSFGSNSLACAGSIHDQPAYVAIESLGDHTKLNNVVSGLFKVTLLRAKDDTPLVNFSGADIEIVPAINASGTAKQGTDFIFSNAHDLRIWGDDKSNAVNLNGMVLYTPEKGAKTVSVSLESVKGAENAGKLEIHPNRKTAQFKIITD